MIGNITDAETIALRICAERAYGGPLPTGANIAELCRCAQAWGYPKDAYPACEKLLGQVRAGLPIVKAEGGPMMDENAAAQAPYQAEPATAPEQPPEEFAIVEIFGHRLRIDVPKNGDFAQGYASHFYGGGSIFSFTPCDRATFDCIACGQHIVSFAHQGPPMCATCKAVPGWQDNPELRRIFRYQP